MERSKKSMNMAIIVHPLSDLRCACPPLFVHFLKLHFIHGKGKSGAKFLDLCKLITYALPSAPPPGPATFIAQCLESLLFIDPPYNEGLSHLLTSALSRVNYAYRPGGDAESARVLAASLLYKGVAGIVDLEVRIIVRLAIVFKVQLMDIEGAMHGLGVEAGGAKAFMEPFILNLIKIRSYTSAVSLLKQFDMQDSASQEFLVTMASDGQPELAGQWASHLGKEMLSFLVQQCVDMGMFKAAYKLVQQYHLHADFPDTYFLYRQSTLRKLVGKGLWDVAESIVAKEPQFLEYLVNLAVEDGDAAKVAEICEHFELKDIPLCPVQKDRSERNNFLVLTDIISEDKIVWVDSKEGLSMATTHLGQASVVGIDCEWKPVQPNKVAILTVANAEFVFVFDLLHLTAHEGTSLDNCIKSIFHSPKILKLGYAVYNDFERLLQSYKDLECFYSCEPVLDLQKVAGKEAKGGLSGLAKKILGSGLDKGTRMSNWEQRPLSPKQLHYAALDAVVLVSIFGRVYSTSPSEKLDLDLKKHMVSFKIAFKVNKRSLDCGESSKNRSTAGDATEKSSKHAVSCVSSSEDLVSATCEVLGLPTPGLLKTELLHLTQVAKLPPPMFNTVSLGPANAAIFCCSVTVAGMSFLGRPAHTKKEAEIWAAREAWLSLFKGISGVVEFNQGYAHSKTKRFLLENGIIVIDGKFVDNTIGVREGTMERSLCGITQREQLILYDKLWNSEKNPWLNKLEYRKPNSVSVNDMRNISTKLSLNGKNCRQNLRALGVVWSQNCTVEWARRGVVMGWTSPPGIILSGSGHCTSWLT